MADRMTTSAAPEHVGRRSAALSQPTFHALYEAMPPRNPGRIDRRSRPYAQSGGRDHGYAQVPVIVWLSYYAERYAGVESPGQRLDDPRLEERAAAGCTGSGYSPNAAAGVGDEEGYIHDARTELVVEVSETTRYVNLGPKKAGLSAGWRWMRRARIRAPDDIYFVAAQEQGVLVQRSIGADGLYRSTVFPGLWLDPVALLKGNPRRLRAVVNLGCATPARHVRRTAGRGQGKILSKIR